MKNSYAFLAALASATVPAIASATSATLLVSSGTTTETGQTYNASASDTSGVASTGGTVYLNGCTVSTTGSSSSTDNSSFYGLDSGVLAYTGGTIYMTGGSVTTSGTGANGIFAYGTGVGYVTDVTVTCKSNAGHAVMCSGGGTLTVNNLTANTAGTNSGAIATDRGGGTILVNGGTIETTGTDSPAIYSTDTIDVANATLTATSSEAIVIEGLNNCTVTNCTISGGKDTYGAVMFVQTTSGDSSSGTGKMYMTNCAMTVTNGPAFFVTNNSAIIRVANSTITNSSTGVLLNAASTTRWGTTGKNGGTATFVAIADTLTGSLVADSISTITASLTNGTTYTGATTLAALTIDDASRWNVSGTSTLTSLTNEGTLCFQSPSYEATVSGTATLSGDLIVDFSSSAPTTGTYTLISAGSISGTFSSFTVGTTLDSGYSAKITYSGTAVTLTVSKS